MIDAVVCRSMQTRHDHRTLMRGRGDVMTPSKSTAREALVLYVAVLRIQIGVEQATLARMMTINPCNSV